PIAFGADVVVHSLTKFFGGHGTTMGGAIVDSGRFSWDEHCERFPMLTEPEPAYHGVVYTKQYGNSAYVARCRTVCQRNTGSVLAPLSAFLLLQGTETLPLRMERHVENAASVARYLKADPRVAWCNYNGDPRSPQCPHQRTLWTARIAIVIAPGNARIGFQVARDAGGVLDVALHSERQGLRSLQKQKGGKRREHGTGVALADRTAARDIGAVSILLRVDHAVIGGLRLGQHRKPFAV